ncbi:TPA: hypothetical protein OTO79_003805, partial [Morganella morganii]|nr:hypothetical protein [Morganella morganii]
NLDSLGNISRFLDGFNDNTLDQSTQTRINQLSNIKMTIENNIVFGYPLNTIVIENAFGYYFYNYGLIGIISYIILLLTLCIKAWNIVIYENKYSNNPYSQSIAIGFLCFYISTIIFSLGSSPIDGHKISYYFWTITGLFLGTMKINESRD